MTKQNGTTGTGTEIEITDLTICSICGEAFGDHFHGKQPASLNGIYGPAKTYGQDGHIFKAQDEDAPRTMVNALLSFELKAGRRLLSIDLATRDLSDPADVAAIVADFKDALRDYNVFRCQPGSRARRSAPRPKPRPIPALSIVRADGRTVKVTIPDDDCRCGQPDKPGIVHHKAGCLAE